MDCAIYVGLTDVQGFPTHCKFAVALPHLGRGGPTEAILLLGSNYFDSSRCGALAFASRQMSVRFVLCTTYVVCDGMY